MDGFRMYLVPDMPSADELLPYLKKMDSNRWYSNFGPLVTEFEERLLALLSTKETLPDAEKISITTLASCHHALEIGLQLVGVKRGDRVLLPAITFAACPLAVQRIGGEVIVADVDPTTWTLTPAIARRVANRMSLAAVMPVTAYGVPIPAEEWDDFSRETHIPVVIDAATTFETQPIPRQGLVAYSFHATKSFGIGEGGMLAGRNSEVIAQARQMSNFGTVDRICYTDGLNAKLSEYHAAVGLAQLDRWSAIKERRKRLLQLYRDYLPTLGSFASTQTGVAKAIVSTLMLLLREPVAEAVKASGKERGVAFHRTYLPPLYRHPKFVGLPVVNTEGAYLDAEAPEQAKWELMRNSEMLNRHLIGVPFHSFMTERDVEIVARHLLQY